MDIIWFPLLIKTFQWGNLKWNRGALCCQPFSHSGSEHKRLDSCLVQPQQLKESRDTARCVPGSGILLNSAQQLKGDTGGAIYTLIMTFNGSSFENEITTCCLIAACISSSYLVESRDKPVIGVCLQPVEGGVGGQRKGAWLYLYKSRRTPRDVKWVQKQKRYLNT